MAARHQVFKPAYKAAVVSLLVFQVAFAQTPENRVRIWTSQDGKFSIEAKFLSLANGSVKLKKNNGKELNVPIHRLSLADHMYISSVNEWGRVWSDADGNNAFVAKFELLKGDKVSLTAITGKELIVELSSLDLDSRKLVLRYKREEATEQSNPSSDAKSTISTSLDASASESSIRKLIADCEMKSRRIRIDGRVRDWSGLPTFDDDTTIDNGSLDIVRVGIAPRKSDLIVMIQTRKSPTREDFSFFIRVDFMGQHETDFQIGLSSASSQKIKVYDEKNDSQLVAEQNLDGVIVKIREVVEVLIPYSTLETVLPKEMRAVLFGEQSRPFMRVETMSYDRDSRSITDYGPSAASYRFLPDEYLLDAPAPGDLRPVLPVSVPFYGKWFVGNGAMGYRAHAGVHAYDFYIMDRQLQPSKVRRSIDNSEYYNWGRPILNPIESTVISVESEHPDGPPLEKSRKPANKVNLSLSGNNELQLRLLHLQQNKINVQEGQKLRAAEVVGLVGNSGQSGWAHLHMDLFANSAQGESNSIPMAFDNAIVSLNSTPNDPWTRYVENWEIRAGVFVEKPEMPQTSER